MKKRYLNTSYIIYDDGRCYSELSNKFLTPQMSARYPTYNLTLNGKKKKVAYKILDGDVVTIKKVEAKTIELKAQEIPIEIVYEDKDIIVVNKPKGMVVHPANGNPDGTLVNAVMAKCKDSLSGIGGKIRPGVVHRIDKDTSRINNNCKK